MSPRLRLAVLAVVCLAQLAVPAWMVLAHERALRDGALYRFRTEPVDPADAFRGRYVAVRLQLLAPREREPGRAPGQPVVAVLGTDAEGFAEVRATLDRPPPTGDWLRGWIGFDWEAPRAPDPAGMVEPVRRTRIELPFDRYYMAEAKARAVDRAWAERGQAMAVARVRVRRGLGAIEGIDVDGGPSERWVPSGAPPQR